MRTIHKMSNNLHQDFRGARIVGLHMGTGNTNITTSSTSEYDGGWVVNPPQTGVAATHQNFKGAHIVGLHMGGSGTINIHQQSVRQRPLDTDVLALLGEVFDETDAKYVGRKLCDEGYTRVKYILGLENEAEASSIGLTPFQAKTLMRLITKKLAEQDDVAQDNSASYEHVTVEDMDEAD